MTALAVILFGVLVGISLAIVLSILDLIRRITSPYADVLGYVSGIAGMHSLDDYPDSEPVEGLVVFRYDSPLFFANTDDFSSRAPQAIDEAPQPVRWFLLNAEANTEVDLTAVDILKDLREELESQSIRFAMARVKQDLQRSLEPTQFIRDVGKKTSSPHCPPQCAPMPKNFTSASAACPRESPKTSSKTNQRIESIT